MKEQIETAVPRIKFVAGDSDEARKRLLGIAARRCSSFEEKEAIQSN